MICRWDSWEIDVREQGTGNREQGTGDREQGTGYREQRTGNRATLLFVTYVGFFPFTYLFTFSKVVKDQEVTAEILS
jgi:hypothetical protein